MASDEGRNALELVKETRRLCEQVGLLLRTADGLVAPGGWKPLSPAVTNTSAHVDAPRKWLPQTAGRFYGNDSRRSILLFVAVILDNRDDKPEFLPFDEPVVTAGWFDYGSDNAIGHWDYWFGQWHVYFDNSADDGVLRSADAKVAWPKETHEFLKVSTLGLPLVSIRNAEGLKARVIDPVLQALAGTA